MNEGLTCNNKMHVFFQQIDKKSLKIRLTIININKCYILQDLNNANKIGSFKL